MVSPFLSPTTIVCEAAEAPATSASAVTIEPLENITLRVGVKKKRRKRTSARGRCLRRKRIDALEVERKGNDW